MWVASWTLWIESHPQDIFLQMVYVLSPGAQRMKLIQLSDDILRARLKTLGVTEYRFTPAAG